MSDAAQRQRIIIHAGFHKTGTTSIQAMIERERNRLAPFAQFYVKAEIGNAPNIARLYGQIPNRFTLQRFETAFTQFLQDCPTGKPIVLSREQLCGALLTGRGRWPFRKDRYHRVSKNLAKAMVRAVRAVFGENADVTLVYTTREDDQYVRSVYGHLLRDTDLNEAFEQFKRRFRRGVNLQATADKIAKALPDVHVVTASLTDLAKSPRGPGQIILDVLDIPSNIQNDIAPPPKRNKPGVSDALATQLLALNQAEISSHKRKKDKKALIVAERKALHGWPD